MCFVFGWTLSFYGGRSLFLCFYPCFETFLVFFFTSFQCFFFVPLFEVGNGLVMFVLSDGGRGGGHGGLGLLVVVCLWFSANVGKSSMG